MSNPPNTSALSLSSIKNLLLMEYKQELEKNILSPLPVKDFYEISADLVDKLDSKSSLQTIEFVYKPKDFFSNFLVCMA